MYQLVNKPDTLTVDNEIYITDYVSKCLSPFWDYTSVCNYDFLLSTPDGYILSNNIIDSMGSFGQIEIKKPIQDYVYSNSASRDRMYLIEKELIDFMRRKLWP